MSNQKRTKAKTKLKVVECKKNKKQCLLFTLFSKNVHGSVLKSKQNTDSLKLNCYMESKLVIQAMVLNNYLCNFGFYIYNLLLYNN